MMKKVLVDDDVFFGILVKFVRNGYETDIVMVDVMSSLV